MELCLLTKAQKKTIDQTLYEYTEQDIRELASLSSSISALVDCMIMYHLYEKKEQCRDIPIYDILKLLIKPIDDFLSEGGPMREETDVDKQEGADHERS